MQFNKKPLNSYSQLGVFDNLLEIGDVMISFNIQKGRLRFERMSPSEAFPKYIFQKRQTCDTDIYHL